MDIYERLINKSSAIAVIGLGYVGYPLAAAFSRHTKVIGFDIDKHRVRRLKDGHLPNEIEINAENIDFTSDIDALKTADFFIIAVPTPINADKTPDLSYVTKASENVGNIIQKDSVVVYESTVYPGVTEDICIPILERCSGLKCGNDFKVGYSPERINPGDKVHALENIVKIVSGCDDAALNTIAAVYELIIRAGVHKMSCIKAAEAAKVAENSQRDINIAFVNELAVVFDKMGISTKEVIEAMNTKWNSLGFYPGLVGGHCIGVDPYYFIYKAEKLGYHSRIILSGRMINDSMSDYVADGAVKAMILSGKRVKAAKVAVFGITFKENCDDCRNSRAADIVERLRTYGIEPVIYDPAADREALKRIYNMETVSRSELNNLDCIIAAVAHDEIKSIHHTELAEMCTGSQSGEPVLYDVKGIFDKNKAETLGFRYLSL